MKIILTYFDAFEGVPVNPTDLVAHRVKELIAESSAEIDLQLLKLPVTFGQSADLLLDTIKKENPQAVIATGVAVGCDKVSFERVAINLDDARIQDNNGTKMVDNPIVEGAPAAYFSTLPTRASFEKAKEANLPVELSYSAGTYVCNHVFYQLMHGLQDTSILGGFVHIPAVTEIPESYAQSGHSETGGRASQEVPHQPLEMVARTLEIMVRETAFLLES